MKASSNVYVKRFALCLAAALLLFGTARLSAAISVGDRVQADGTVNVRQTAAGASLGTQSSGSRGTVVDGPTVATLNGTSYTWYKVNFDTGVDGWVAHIGLTALKCDIVVQGTPTISPNPVTAGNRITVSYTIRNSGPGNAGTSQTKIQIKNSSGTQITAPTFSAPAINASASTSQSNSVTIPTGIPAGTYTAFVVLDNRDELDQSNRDNDLTLGVNFTVSAPVQQLPDLLPQNVTLSSSAATAGGTLTVTFDIRNQGGASAPTTTTRLRLNQSSGATSPGDVSLGDVSTPAVTANGVASRLSRQVTIPPGTAAGTYYVWVVADNGAALTQSNYTNDYARSTALAVSASSPSIMSVSPNPLVGSNSDQTLTVDGSGFASGAQVRLRCAAFGIDSTKAAALSGGTRLSVSATFGNDPSTWTAQVINPGGAASGLFTFTVRAPVPVIQSLSPAGATAGGTAFTLRVNGNTFHQTSVVRWNGANRTTTPVVSSGGLTTALDARISAADIASAGSASVSVDSPGPGGGTSAAATLNVGGGTGPTIASVSPGTYPASGDPQTMTIDGSNFRSGATLTFRDPGGGSFNSTASRLTFVSSGQIKYQFNNANDVGTWTVKVNNPDGQSSNAASFTVTASSSAPNVTGVSPNPVTGSDAAQLFKINGTGFTSQSKVTLRDKTAVKTFTDLPVVSQTGTQIVIEPVFTAAAHTWSAQVINGAQASGEFTFQVVAPANTAAPPKPASPGTAGSPGTTIGDLTPTFTWSPAAGATGYGLYIRDMTAADTPLVYPNGSGVTATPLKGSSFTLPGGYLVSGHTYRWNMTSFVGSAESTNASAPLYFKTAVSGAGGFSLSFPLPPLTHETAAINSVFDHAMRTPYAEDGVVVAYTGERGEVGFGTDGGNSPGYKNSAGTPFRVNGNYTGAGEPVLLNYDGHPGIDYRAASGTLVYATADGVVRYPSSIPGLSDAARFHTVAIDHENGYVTYFLHCSTHPSAGNAVLPEGAPIKRGEVVARVGDAGVSGRPHLHVEVHFQGVPLDPYGWNGAGQDPYTDADNRSLWETGRAACQEPTAQEVSDHADQLSLTYKVPAVLIKALVEQESINWQHCGVIHTEPDGRIGIGLSQMTLSPDADNVLLPLGVIREGAPEGENPFTTTAQDFSVDVSRLKNDWQYNLEVGVRTLIAKKVESGGAGDDASILENWYYPLAYYNGAKRYNSALPINNDPNDPRYTRAVSANSQWKDKRVFPYQECVFNIIAQLYPIPASRRPFFGPPIKVTLPGPSAVEAGAGRYSFVEPTFCFFDWAQYFDDGTVHIGNWGTRNNGCVTTRETRAGIDFHKVRFGAVTPPAAAPASIVQMSAPNYINGEGAGAAAVTVTRTGDVSGAAAVEFVTVDDSSPAPCSAVNGTAYARCDYATTVKTLAFAANETSKTVTLSLTDDAYVEGTETMQLRLRNAVGAALGTQNSATAIIVDNDAAQPAINPLDDSTAQFYVRQQYYDFLNREPDAGGLKFWADGINGCGSDAVCSEVKRINTSAAFFLSIEFQETGYLVHRTYKAAFGDATGTSTFPNTHQLSVPVVRFQEFLRDTQRIGQGVVVRQEGWEQQLENNKQAYVLGFVQQQRFQDAFPSTMTAAELVGRLNQNAGGVLSEGEAAQLTASLGPDPSDPSKRAAILRQVAENAELRRLEFNRAFVLMQYFGYLRRNPNEAQDTDHTGYDFWLTKLNQFDGDFVQAEMVKAFSTSTEYRQRFGRP